MSRPPIFGLLAALTLLGAAAAPAVELYSGVSRTLVIPPQDEPALIGDYSFQAPPGTRWAAVEATTADPTHDVDLYVRFGRPVEEGAGGATLADFRSETAAGPDEHVFIGPGVEPPLQTGLYYVALRVRTLGEEIRVTLRATVEPGGPAETFVISTFDSGSDDGWTRNYPPSTLAGATVGDSETARSLDPGGFYRLADTVRDVRRDFAVAPSKFLGDLSGFSDGAFTYDFRHADGDPPVYRLELRLIGPAGAYRWRGGLPPTGEWIEVVVRLDDPAWERVAGGEAFEQVLRNVSRIEVSMDHSAGFERNDLDNFAFTGDAPPPPPGAGGPSFSGFENGLDGWTRNFPASPVPFASIGSENAAIVPGVGGSQGTEGFLLMIDGGGRNTDYVVAPEKFIRGLADLDRPWYEFDYRRFEGVHPAFPITLRLLGNGAVYEWKGPRPRDVWLNLRVAIAENNWVHERGPDDFHAMLRNVQRLEVLMDASTGPEVNGLDNFHLRTEYTSPAGRSLELSRNEVSLELEQGDAAERRAPLEIRTRGGGELGWQATVASGTTWLRIEPGAGETPSDVELVVDPAAVPPGRYEGEIVVEADELGVQAKRLAVTLLVGEDPRIPRVTGAGSAANAHVALAPGALGSLFGRFLAGETRAVEPSDGRFPAAVDGVELLLLDSGGAVIAAAPLLYLSPDQINFQTPYEVAGRDLVFLVVRRDGFESEPFTATVAPAAPAVFSQGGELSAVLNADGTLHSAAAPVEPGGYVTVYFSGMGPVRPALETGRLTPAAPLRTPTLSFAAEIAGGDAQPIGAALSPGFLGLAQMSVRVPQGLAPGRRVLRIFVDGRASNGIFLWVR